MQYDEKQRDHDKLHKSYIGVGSNLGDRLKNLFYAKDFLQSDPEINLKRSSPIYQTEAIGIPDAPDFYNCVLRSRPFWIHFNYLSY